jgi:hypothetical protein
LQRIWAKPGSSLIICSNRLPGALSRQKCGGAARLSSIVIVQQAIPLLGILGLSGWLTFIRPELLPLASKHVGLLPG